MIISLKEPSGFFVKVTNPVGGDSTPIEFNVRIEVFGQKLGVIMQAATVREVVSETK